MTPSLSANMSHATQDGVPADTGATSSTVPLLPTTPKNCKSWRQQGRSIRRLVTLVDVIQDLIDDSEEARRRSLGGMNLQCTAEEEWRSKTYEHLAARLPQFKQWVANPVNANMVAVVVKQLSEGADAARGDDAALLKTRVVLWLSEEETPQPRLFPSEKTGRGFHNDSTARLICPVDYDWGYSEHRDKIRDWDPRYLVTADMWPRFLYEGHKYDPNEPTKGLFTGKGPMLVRAFKAIFTSPSSAKEEEEPSNPLFPNKRRRGERRTRTHVANLVAMKSVEPRAIAYTAVQLQFALSDCTTWRLVDGLFEYEVFYRHIVRWFEDTEEAEKTHIDDLLLWWNRTIFGRAAVLNYTLQASSSTSVTASFKRRRTNGQSV